jgi:integrase/recombinase XerC
MDLQKQSSLKSHLEMFMLHQEASHHTKRTIDFYHYHLDRFLQHLAEFDLKSPDEITAHHIRLFIVNLERQNLSSAYVHTYARAIRTFCNFLVNEEILSSSPMKSVKMPKLDDKILPPFTESDIKKLLTNCEGKYKNRDKAIILCLLDSGLRAAEFASLNVDDIEPDGIIKIMGKGRKERWVRLSAKSRKELTRYLLERGELDEGDPLWMGKKGRLTISGLLQAMERIGKRAKVWPVGLHRFRRTFAIASVRNGMDVHRLREILGHEDVSTAQQYLKFAREDIVDIHKQTSPVDNWKL